MRTALLVYLGKPLRVVTSICAGVFWLSLHFKAKRSKIKPGLHCRQVTLFMHLMQLSMQALQILLALSTKVF